MLIQINSAGPRIIAYGNKSLSGCEKRYCQTEKEALALVWAIEHFKIYLYGKNEFDLISVHKPLETIFGKKSKPCARIERWVLRLQAYNCRIVYFPGKNNIADPLSRLCAISQPEPFDNENYINQLIDYALPVAVSLGEIVKRSEKDEEILTVKKGIMERVWENKVNTYKIFESGLCFQDAILLRGNKLVIPVELRGRILQAVHEGHPGITAMKGRLRTKVWWPKIDKDAEKIVRNCKSCTLVTTPNPPNPMKRRTFPTAPWIDVAMDFMEPLLSSDYLFVIVDYYSRYKEIKILKNIDAKNTIRTMEEIFSRLEFPRMITADNGPQFACHEMQTFCSGNGIILHNTIPYWPQMNGEVERQNKDTLKRLKISQIEKKDWKQNLLRFLMMYNSTPHSVTGKTPSELFYGRQFRDKLPSSSDLETHTHDPETRDKDTEAKEKGKQYSDRKRQVITTELKISDR